MSNKYCIIMAGGIGSRFWPVSRNAVPKQFLDIFGVGRTFLQQTYDRFIQIIEPQHFMVVTAERYKDLVYEQLPDIPQENILLEPHRRNTAPCIAYATYKLMQKDPSALVVVAPSDHLIIGDAAFLATIEAAFEFARQKDALITLGIKPTRPEVGYGYIQAIKKEYQSVGDHLVYPVKTFTEKPSADLAKILVDSGEFYWNSGIFVWSVAAIDRQMMRWIPSIALPFKNLISTYYTEFEESKIRTVYEGCRNLSVDYGVMEKADNTFVFSAIFGWSDIGSWESYYMHTQKDEHDNALALGHSFLENVKGSLLYSDNKEKLVVAKDLQDYLIVDTKDVLLVCPKDDSQFRQLFNEINNHQESFV